MFQIAMEKPANDYLGICLSLHLVLNILLSLWSKYLKNCKQTKPTRKEKNPTLYVKEVIEVLVLLVVGKLHLAENMQKWQNILNIAKKYV